MHLLKASITLSLMLVMMYFELSLKPKAENP